jgi:TP901 family phage tail tape measure protein
MSTLADLLIRLGLDTRGLDDGLFDAQTRLGRFGNSLTNVFKFAGGMVLAEGIMQIGEAFSKSAKDVLEFEKKLSDIKAVSGSSVAEMSKLKDIIITEATAMGKGTTETAKAVEELSKSGLTLKQIAEGGLKGALQLATAGEVSMADAAEIASTALNAFKKDSLNTVDAANILAGAANASATDVKGLQMGLSQVSAVASGAGMSFKDTTTALAIFAQNGLKGSDAGTSLKSMLMNLQPKTKEQSEEFKKLNLLTAEGANKFFDAQGKMKSLTEVSEILKTSFSGMTDQQRLASTEIIFGSDAIRAATVLYKEGSAGINSMAESMNKVTAAEVATEKLNNLSSALEKMGNLFSTSVKLMSGEGLLQSLKVPIDAINKSMTTFINATVESKSALTGLKKMVEEMGVNFNSLGKIFEPFIRIYKDMIKIIDDWWKKHGTDINNTIRDTWNKVMAFINPVLELFKQSFLNLYSQIVPIWEQIKQTFISLQPAFSAMWEKLKPILTVLVLAIGGILTVAIASFNGIISAIAPFVEAVLSAFKAIISIVGALAALLTGDYKKAWELSKQAVSAIIDTISNLIIMFLSAVKGYIEGLGAVFKGFGNDVMTGLWKGIEEKVSWLLSNVKDMASKVSGAVKEFFGISSPSRLMQEYGMWIAWGLAEGINKNSKYAEYASKQMANSSFTIMKEAIERLTYDLDKISDATVIALKNRYKAEEQILTASLQRQIDQVRTATNMKIAQYERDYEASLKLVDKGTDATVKNLRDQIDAINEKTKNEDKLLKEGQYNYNIAVKQREIVEAKSNDERIRAQYELSEMIKEHAREQVLEERQIQIEKLNKQIELEYKNAEEKKKILTTQFNVIKTNEENIRDMQIASYETQLSETQKHFEALNKEEALQAEARKLILSENNVELLTLLDSYNPGWKLAGQSFGESLLKGLESKRGEIQSVVNNMLNMVSAINNATISSPAFSSPTKNQIPYAPQTTPSVAEYMASKTTPLYSLNNYTSIPKLAKGGIATKETLATVGEGSEPEAILPLSKLENLINFEMPKMPKTELLETNILGQLSNFIKSLAAKANMPDLKIKNMPDYSGYKVFNNSVAQNTYKTENTENNFEPQQITNNLSSDGISVYVNLDGRTIMQTMAPHMVRELRLQGV